HPRWLAAELARHSRLVEVAGASRPVPAGVVGTADLVDPLDGVELRDLALPPVTSALVTPGEERGALVTPADVFGRLLEGDDAGTDGLDALLHAPEVASLVVPDLYSPAAVPDAEPVEEAGVFAGPAFAPCLARGARRHPAPAAPGLAGLHLDPGDPAQL